jgi:hypothetical protein
MVIIDSLSESPNPPPKRVQNAITAVKELGAAIAKDLMGPDGRCRTLSDIGTGALGPEQDAHADDTTEMINDETYTRAPSLSVILPYKDSASLRFWRNAQHMFPHLTKTRQQREVMLGLNGGHTIEASTVQAEVDQAIIFVTRVVHGGTANRSRNPTFRLHFDIHNKVVHPRHIL